MSTFASLLTGLAGSVVSATAGVAAGTITITRRTRVFAPATGKDAYTTVDSAAGIAAVKSRRMVTMEGGPGSRSMIAAVVYTVNAADITGLAGAMDQNTLITDGSASYEVVKVESRLAGRVFDLAVRDVGVSV